MFNANILDTGEISFTGRLDASQVDAADKILGEVTTSRTINLKGLEYISSAGLGVLLAHQKRLKETGHAMRLVNLNNHVKDIFMLTGFNYIFEIE